jgi:branched-chain amino acid transport system ATP-binding protein
VQARRARARGKRDDRKRPLLHIDQVSKRFGGFVALDGIDLTVAPGERLGLIGPERLRQEHAGQLHLRHAAQRDRQRRVRRPQDDGLIAHERTRLGLARSFQLPRRSTRCRSPTTCACRCSTR